jgi:hypothetical protein
MDVFVGESSPELTALRDNGSKHFTWHIIADEVASHKLFIQYRHTLRDVFGGVLHIDGFPKLFLAPGIGHCVSGPGALPETFWML